MSALEQSLDDIIGSKRSTARSGDGPRASRSRGSRGAAPYDRSSTSGGRWPQDRAEGGGDRYDRRPRRAEPTTSLRVSNVHWDLSEQDMRELFEQVGQVVQCRLHYDRAGRSLGTLNIEFRRPDDARAAVRRFDGKMAMGQPIRVESASSSAGAPLVGRLSRLPGDNSAISRQGGRGAGGPALKGSLGERGGQGKGKKTQLKPRTAEDLDAELDAFMSGRGNGAAELTTSSDARSLKVAEGSGEGMAID